jgi:hypothetical protein
MRLLHEANYRELKRVADQLESEDDESTARILELWSEHRRLYAVLDETARLLHNFLASATTLIDHTRAHVTTQHAGTAFEKEYKARVHQAFGANPISRFVQCLRNYNLHYRLPVVSGRLNVQFDPPGQTKSITSQIVLDVCKLQEWDKWDSASKRYMKNVGEELAVDRLADDYMGLALPFHDWFRERDLEIHYPDIKRVRAQSVAGGER